MENDEIFKETKRKGRQRGGAEEALTRQRLTPPLSDHLPAQQHTHARAHTRTHTHRLSQLKWFAAK